MFDSQHFLLEQRQKELIHERELHDLAQTAMAGRDPDSPFYAETLAAFGRQLITWGEQLEGRYAMACAPETLTAEANC